MHVRNTKYRSVCIRFVKLYNRHAFETFYVPPNNRDGCFSGVQHKGFDSEEVRQEVTSRTIMQFLAPVEYVVYAQAPPIMWEGPGLLTDYKSEQRA